MKPAHQQIAKEVKACMKELKVRQQQAANELGFSQATISLWLSGKYPANGTSEKIARAFLTWKDRRRKSPLQHTHKARQISIRNKPKPHTKTQWTTREEEMLIQEVLEHGLGNWEEKARVVTGGSVNLPTSMGEVFVFSENAKGRQPFHQFMVEHSGVTTFVASRSASMQDRCHRYPQQPAIEAGTMSGVFEALSEPGAPYKPEVLSRDPWVVYFHEVGDTRRP